MCLRLGESAGLGSLSLGRRLRSAVDGWAENRWFCSADKNAPVGALAGDRPHTDRDSRWSPAAAWRGEPLRVCF